MDTAVAVTTFRDEEKLLSPTDLPPPPSSDGNVSAVVQVESENEISNVQLESRQNEQTTVQVTVSFDAPVKDDDKPNVHTAQSESPSVKGGYNLRCQPRSVVRLVDQPARLSMPMKAGKADEKAGRIVRKRFGAKIRDDTKQSRSAVGDGKRKRRTKRSGARSKVQTSSEEKGKRQRKRPCTMVNDVGSSLKHTVMAHGEVSQSRSSLKAGEVVLMDYEMNEKMLAMIVRKVKEALVRRRREGTAFCLCKFLEMRSSVFYFHVATELKKFLDDFDSPPWQVIVGRSFGVDVTYDLDSFAYFFLGDIGFMVFRHFR
ncbi:Dynein light domain containing protein [Trichuris trichiura]|uniref:Dynein light domain containing protein n=1 Tax=Trichuris trichiura TaxID=36087 RepID=A0A077Z9T4_TRITR|nr:Dynein light domain containing protein [Trichuris trichiura]